MTTKNTIDSFHTFQFQSDLLLLHLQLAEGDDKPKRSGVFESTYKNAAGNEVTITRTPDGRFGTKGGGASAPTTSESKKQETPAKEGAATGGGAEMVRNLLNGELGKQLKKSIIDSIDKNSAIKDVGAKIGNAINEANIKTGVQQAQFSEIVGKTGDAIGNAQKYIKDKFDDIARGASDSETCQNIGKTLVAGMVAGALAGTMMAVTGGTAAAITTAAVSGYAIALVVEAVQDSARISKRNKYNFEHRFEIAAKKDRDEKFAAMIKRFDDEAAQKKLLEDIKTVVAAKREEANPPPKVNPQADSAAKAELAGASGASLKKSLIAGAAENPNIAAGIEATKMIDVVSGPRDFFSNTKQFMSDKIQEAAAATSEKTKDMAIGAAITGALTAAFTMGKDLGAEAGKVVRDQVKQLLDGTGMDEKVKAELESTTPESVKKAISDAKLFMTDALIRKIVMERTKEAIVKAVTELKAKVESGEAAESVLASVKDLPARVKDLTDRMQASVKQIQDALSKQSASRQQDAPASNDNEATV